MRTLTPHRTRQRLVSILAIFNVLSPVFTQQTPIRVAGINDISYDAKGYPPLPLTNPWASYGRGSLSSWNGLITFAHTEPLKCFDPDQDTKYDAAILGMRDINSLKPLTDLWISIIIPLGAPFDTATSYRPGYKIAFGAWTRDP